MNASRPLIRTASAVTALGLCGLTLAGCGSSGGEKEENGKLNVVASFYPMQFLAQQIGGEHVEVESLTKPGTEPHDLELSPRQTARLSEAGLVVYLKGLQPAVDEGVQQAEPEHVAEATSFTDLEKHGGEVHGEEGHGEDHGHEHSAGGGQGGDPHVWLDPVRYAEIARGVGDKLAKADPAHSSAYQKNASDLRKRLLTLDEEYRSGLKTKKTDTFITTHAAFGYLAERYRLHEAAVTGVDPDAEPSGARMKELHKIAKADDVDTVFFESSASDRTAKTLAGDLNLKTGVLSPVETVEKGQDYFSVMRRNLISLRTALGAG